MAGQVQADQVGVMGAHCSACPARCAGQPPMHGSPRIFMLAAHAHCYGRINPQDQPLPLARSPRAPCHPHTTPG